MSAEGRSKSESALISTAHATLSATAASGAYDAEADPILATLKRSPLKKRSPGGKWDGRVAGMTLQEYRDRKWSTDACYAKVERRGPAFTMRKPLPNYLGKGFTNFCVGDPVRALDNVLRSSPAFSMGIQSFAPPPDKSPGPAEYANKSTMDPSRHPTIPKNSGARFGSEVLEPRDPTGPAPGDYDPNAIVHSSTLRSVSRFTIQGRESWKPPTEAPGPGVGEFDIAPITRVGKLTPLRYTIQGKTEPLDKPLGSRQYEAPGPAHYDIPWGLPGAPGAKKHPMRQQAPIWKFGSEPRGLRN